MKPKRIIILLILSLLSISFGCSRTAVYDRKLSRGETYNPEHTQEISSYIRFTYQEADHPDLKYLREELGLDAYIFSRSYLSETEMILDLLHYSHQIVPWDGSADWPEGSLNTISILAHAKKQSQGVNCRMKAIILQEIYLAAGIPARVVSCIPFDKHDKDSHVIVSVWSSQMSKWIWVDPSFNAYVINNKGELSSIAEVRNGLIQGDSFYLNNDAVLRDNPLDESFYFDYYMKKNLYAFISPMESRFDYEGSKGNRYNVLLLPSIELKREKNDLIQTYCFRDSCFTRYIISDPKLFWEPPESESKNR